MITEIKSLTFDGHTFEVPTEEDPPTRLLVTFHNGGIANLHMVYEGDHSSVNVKADDADREFLTALAARRDFTSEEIAQFFPNQ